MNSTEISKSIPQQINLTHIVWFNELLKKGIKLKDINRKNNTFNKKIDLIFNKYNTLIENEDFNETLKILLFLEKNKNVEQIDKSVISFCIHYIKNELNTLIEVEKTITIDKNIKTFKTVFNTRTLGYTKTFYNQLLKKTNLKIFKNIDEIIMAVKKTIFLTDIYKIDTSLANTTIQRRNSTLQYWQNLILKV